MAYLWGFLLCILVPKFCALLFTNNCALLFSDYNPKVLADIISDSRASRERVVYVGDSKMKDIHMANEAGVTSVWARFGCEIPQEEYELLKLVSHWTDQDIEKENQIKRTASSKYLEPDYTLETGLHELLSIFSFEPFNV